jgi:hypothetical protein
MDYNKFNCDKRIQFHSVISYASSLSLIYYKPEVKPIFPTLEINSLKKHPPTIDCHFHGEMLTLYILKAGSFYV